MSFPREPNHPPVVAPLTVDGDTTPRGVSTKVCEAVRAPEQNPRRADRAGLSIDTDNRAGDDTDRSVRELMASLPWNLELGDGNPLDAVLAAFGHDRRCRMRVKAGLAVTCECRTRPPVDNAAIAIGLAIRFARIGLSRRLPLPHGIVERLARHVGDGDPAAAMVWDSLARRGFVEARTAPPKMPQRPTLRLVCTEES